MQLVINASLFLDVLLMKIREVSLLHGKKRAQDAKKRELEIMEKLASAKSFLSENYTQERHETVSGLEDELELIRKDKIQGLIVRSRANWHCEGEKPSHFFLSLEKTAAARKTVTWLEVNGSRIEGSKKILQSFTKVLSKRYQQKIQIQNGQDNHYVKRNTTRKLLERDRNRLEKEITVDEITAVVKKMKGGKSPGSNGFTIEFVKYFWSDLKYFFCRSFREALRKGETSVTQREGVVTLIPKGRDRLHEVSGWRAITLLNIDCKIFSGVVAERLKSVITQLVSEDQTGYLKGRFIAQNTRLTHDTIEFCEKEKIKGALMAIDFETAFEAVSWKFMRLVLEANNFGSNFIGMCNTLYMNSENFSRILYKW